MKRDSSSCVTTPRNMYICPRLSYNLHYRSNLEGAGPRSKLYMYSQHAVPNPPRPWFYPCFLQANYSRMSPSQGLAEAPLLSSWSSARTAPHACALQSLCPRVLRPPPSACACACAQLPLWKMAAGLEPLADSVSEEAAQEGEGRAGKLAAPGQGGGAASPIPKRD